MGPICAGKSSRVSPDRNLPFMGEQPMLDGVGALQDVGLVCRRLPDGRMACNVPHMIVHHSPTGFDVGYGGSGPADLALNILNLLLPPNNLRRGVPVGAGEVSAEAYELHQDFKWKFISSMARDGGAIPIEEINGWVIEKMATREFLEQMENDRC